MKAIIDMHFFFEEEFFKIIAHRFASDYQGHFMIMNIGTWLELEGVTLGSG